MNYIMKIKAKLYKIISRVGLKNREFTIISNNCWGGFVYQRYDLVYRTPFIGLFVFAPDYIRLLNDLEKYMNKELIFIDASKSKYVSELKKSDRYNKYPIALLDDVEIHFLHYKDKDEARLKWNRRVKRINYNNMLVKFSDRDLCNERLIYEFDKMNFKNKLCFTAKNYNLKSTVQLSVFEDKDYVESEWVYQDNYINLKNILNDLI